MTTIERDAIIRARLAACPEMTPPECERQRASFARGNVKIDEPESSCVRGPMNHPGFYCVVRFCLDIERGEAVNVGVIVGAPGLGMRVRMAERNEYVKRRCGAEAFDNTRLALTKGGFAERLKEVEPTAEAVAAFGAAEAGKLQLSPPRPMVVTDLDGEVLALFQRLVEDPETLPSTGGTWHDES